ncbi:hypothetical protein A1D22_09135 [Pasteurellaceae bacterium LFhippo2]|nr:hypothetical protein [Pasteurellaceae bacterium LFhippo2]
MAIRKPEYMEKQPVSSPETASQVKKGRTKKQLTVHLPNDIAEKLEQYRFDNREKSINGIIERLVIKFLDEQQ